MLSCKVNDVIVCYLLQDGSDSLPLHWSSVYFWCISGGVCVHTGGRYINDTSFTVKFYILVINVLYKVRYFQNIVWPQDLYS